MRDLSSTKSVTKFINENVVIQSHCSRITSIYNNPCFRGWFVEQNLHLVVGCSMVFECKTHYLITAMVKLQQYNVYRRTRIILTHANNPTEPDHCLGLPQQGLHYKTLYCCKSFRNLATVFVYFSQFQPSLIQPLTGFRWAVFQPSLEILDMGGSDPK